MVHEDLETGLTMMNDDANWQAVLERDRRSDGRFIFAVSTTGIYCRPSCPARRPRRDRVRFFSSTLDAERAGYRPCRRCNPHDSVAPEVVLVQQVCTYIDEHLDGGVTLTTLGAQVGYSPYHLQRLFKRMIGLTPLQYANDRRASRLKAQLKEGQPVTGALYDAGYGSSSHLYTQAPARLGMTPTNYQKGGAGMNISYTTSKSPIGWLIVATTERGVCAVEFGDSAGVLEDALQHEFPAATLAKDDAALQPFVEAISRYLGGRTAAFDLPLDVRATAFQSRVWAALRDIPYGDTRSYGQVARAIGAPAAARAVAQACAGNPVALLIPCHRVVRENGALSGYRWGVQRKRSLLNLEAQKPVSAAMRLDEVTDSVGAARPEAELAAAHLT
ncbi:MAG: bifunctional DNA-binding transcriptional regulator/O6-methylguanine-DNA methyltransferase Ada [Chloroflexi bacterium]|nr:bifunctional DNA-binding transcriptional regulator/O6-methylguanine-DNA methyltransferase Ada [Chloroflexota bacterium]